MTTVEGGSATSAGNLREEVSFVVRRLRRKPAFATAVVLSLAIGVGANTAVFGVFNSVLLRPPPYRDADELVFVWNQLSGFASSRLPMFANQVSELRTLNAFADVAGVWATTRTVSSDDRTTLVPSGLVTPNFFSVLGVEAARGRTFGEDAGVTGATIIISDAYWRAELGADPAAVGQGLIVDGSEAIVIGVLPPEFKLLFPEAVGIPEQLDLFTPLPWIATNNLGGSRYLRTVARLRPGMSLSIADREVKKLAASLRARHVQIAEAGDQFVVVPLQADAVARIRPALTALLIGVGLFMLLTAANVTNLILARGRRIEKELAIRSWLGASQRSLGRMLLLELGLLCAAGTVLGLWFGVVGSRLLWSARPIGLARVDEIAIDGTVALYVAAIASAAALFVAVLPLRELRSGSRQSLLARSRGTISRRQARGRKYLTAAEFAICLVIVVSSGLVAQTLLNLRSADLGYRVTPVLAFRVGLPNQHFQRDSERSRLAEEIERKVGLISGVESVGGSSHMPLSDWANWSGVAAPPDVAAEDREQFHFDHRSVTPGFFDAIGARVVGGRIFTTGDTGDSQPVVIVDEALAARVFPDGDPVGRSIVATRYVDGEFRPQLALVIGVIGQMLDRSPSQPTTGQVFWPFAQSARWEVSFAVRFASSEEGLRDRIREVVSGVHGDLGAADFRFLEDDLSTATAGSAFTALLASVFSALAMTLAAVGLYGVVAYSTAQRTGEFGLRVAVGASAGDLFLLVLREGLEIGSIGVGVGLVGALTLASWMKSILFEVSAFDIPTFIVVSAFLVAVAATASLVPAMRIRKLDPVRSLQTE